MTVPIAVTGLPDRHVDRVRVLHTSDWHLGVAVRHVPRDIDHDSVIDEIVAIAAAASPDVIVHTGDLFHGGRPGMADFARAIRALRALAEVAPTVVLAGNHDSSVALETLGVAVEDPVPAAAAAGTYDATAPCPARIRVIYQPETAANGAVMTFPTASGRRLRLCALPFLHANRVLVDFADIVSSHATYADAIAGVCNRLGQAAFDNDFDPTNDVAVLASHLHVAGARTSSEKEIHISSEYATDPANIESRYGYLAFGHIHIAQPVASGRGRYAGSILEVDFGEEGEAKQVVVADLVPGRPTNIHDIALTAGRRLHRVRAPYSQLARHAARVGAGLVEVTVQLEPDPSVTPAGDPSSGIDALQTGDETTPAEGLRVSLDIPGFDTLSDAVVAALPDATVVAVVDARRPDVATADEIDMPEVTETTGELFRSWLAEHGHNAIAKSDAHNADPERICGLFDELHAAVTTDSEVDVPEAATIDELLADEANR